MKDGGLVMDLRENRRISQSNLEASWFRLSAGIGSSLCLQTTTKSKLKSLILSFGIVDKGNRQINNAWGKPIHGIALAGNVSSSPRLIRGADQLTILPYARQSMEKVSKC